MQHCRPCWQRSRARAPGPHPRWAAPPLLPRPRLHIWPRSPHATHTRSSHQASAPLEQVGLYCRRAPCCMQHTAAPNLSHNKVGLGGVPASARLAAMAAARSSSSSAAAGAGRERIRSATSVPSCMPHGTSCLSSSRKQPQASSKLQRRAAQKPRLCRGQAPHGAWEWRAYRGGLGHDAVRRSPEVARLLRGLRALARGARLLPQQRRFLLSAHPLQARARPPERRNLRAARPRHAPLLKHLGC